MSYPSPSGGGGGPGRPLSSLPLSFQTILDPVPRPYRPNIFDEPPYSCLRNLDISQMVEISDSSDFKSSGTSGPEECEATEERGTSSNTPVEVAESSQEREEEEEEEDEEVPEGPWSLDEVKSRITEADLDRLRSDYSVPDSITLWVPEDNELPSSPSASEVALNRWFFKCGLRLPLPHFVRHLLRDIRLAPLQLNPNTWRGIYCCYVLWQEHFGFNPCPAEIQACFEIRSAANKVGSFCYYPRRRKFL